MALTFIGVGANLGERLQSIESAIKKLQWCGRLMKRSSLYESRALTLDNQPQPNYLNAVIELHTTLEPKPLLEELHRIEEALGRTRCPSTKWQPRRIDLDILYYDSLVRRSDTLTIPHPEIANRLFVLMPLCEIAPDWIDPLSQKTVSELLKALLLSKRREDRDCFPFQTQ